MKSRLLILVIALLSIAFVGQAFAAATVTVIPSQVPKGAYVDGPGGPTDDNYYWQMVKITFGGVHAFGATDIVITLPTGMTIADTDAAGGPDNDVSLSWVTAGLTTFAVNAATVSGSISIDIGAANTAINDVLYVMFPVETQTNPSVTSAGYAVSFIDNTDDADIVDTSGPQITYRAAGALDVFPFASNLSGDQDSTTTFGQVYPASLTAMWSATNADFVKDLGRKAFGASNLLEANLLANGDFAANANGWTLATGAAYAAAKITLATGAGGAGTATQDFGAIVGHTYTLTYTATSVLGTGTIRPAIGATLGTLRTPLAGSTTYTETIVAAAGNLVFTGSTLVGETVTIDDIVLSDDVDDITYTLWAASDSTLSHVNVLTTGVTRAVNFVTGENYTFNEGATGSAGNIATAAVPEGEYYFYITSSLTGDFPLARSGKLVVRHYPEAKILGWDYDAVGGYDNIAPFSDDNNVTLDTGLYFGYTGAVGTTPRQTLDTYINVEDYDDNARVSLYYSTSTGLTASNVTTSGTSPNIVVTGLTGATLLADTLYENSKNTDGFLMWTWDVTPEGTTFIPAAGYTLYAVANDGKHQSLIVSNGSDPGDQETVTIKHSPNLEIDNLLEYDPDGAAPVEIETGNFDTIMLNWGKNGVDGDFDIDDSAKISFYIAYDAAQDGNADYSSTQAEDLLGDINDLTGGVHQIITGLNEDPDSQVDQYYSWNLKADFASTGWYPTTTAPANEIYHLYAIIDENKTDGTKRLVALGDGGLLISGGALTAINFTNKPFARLSAPPAEGITINAEETYRLPFNAFDWPVNSQLGVYLVKNDAAGFEAGPDTTSITSIVASTAGKAYLLTDNDGALGNGGTAYIAENTGTYYDMTIRPPAAAGAATYINSMNDGTDLGNGTYWVYVGTDHAVNGEFTGSANNWTTTAGWAYGGNAVSKAGGAVGALNQTVSIVPGEAYTLTFTIGAVGVGTVTPKLGGAAGTAVAIGAGGTFTETIIAGALNSKLEFIAAAAGVTVASLDNVSVVSTLHRAPGPLTVVNAGLPTAQRNLTITPTEANVAQNDTLTFIVKAADNSADVDRMDYFISVDKDWWTLVSPSAPFTAAAAYTDMLIANAAIDDAVNNRWILRAVVFDAANNLGTVMANTGLGDDVASFRLVSKGTSDALQHITSVGFVIDPANNWVTKFSFNGADQSINTLSSTVKVVPRGIVEGIVELQGRTQMNVTYNFDLLPRGGYEAITDSLFLAANDDDAGTAGLQIIPDTDGKFTLFKVPTGEFELVAKYSRYLSKKIPVNVYPGIDTLFVSFGQLLGGDSYGYSDSLGYVNPDNEIGTGDINQVATAFLATSADAEWNDGTHNWKWADINEDGVVETDDLALTTANEGAKGAQPRYKLADLPVLSNKGSLVEFMNLPSELKAGDTYTIQVVARNTSAVRAYFVNMQYDTAALSLNEISSGGYIGTESLSFPVIGEGRVGLANSVYGDALTSGDGVLAEVSFTARTNGMFDANMLTFEAVNFVNGEFVKEDLVGASTNVNNKTPLAFALVQNFPNPFNPTTIIGFSIPESGQVNIEVFDILGRHVRSLASRSYQSGSHSVVWDGRDDNSRMVSAGTYVYTIKSGKYTAAKKMLFVK